MYDVLRESVFFTGFYYSVFKNGFLRAFSSHVWIPIRLAQKFELRLQNFVQKSKT